MRVINSKGNKWVLRVSNGYNKGKRASGEKANKANTGTGIIREG